MKNNSSIYVRVSPAFKNTIRKYVDATNQTESEFIRNALNMYIDNLRLFNHIDPEDD